MRSSPHITIREAMLAGATLAALAAGGCSFLFSEGPPADHMPRPFLSCGESYAPPVLDTIAAGLLGLTAVGAKKDAGETEAQYQGAVAFVGTVAVVAAAGAVYGYGATASCREAKQARAMATWRAAWLPPPYGSGPWGAPPRTWPPAPPAPAATFPPRTAPVPAPASSTSPPPRPAEPPSDEEPSVTVDPSRTGPPPTP